MPDEARDKGWELARELVRLAALLFKWYLNDDEADEAEELRHDILKRLESHP